MQADGRQVSRMNQKGCKKLNEAILSRSEPVLAEGPDAFAMRVKHEVPMYKEVIEKAGLKIKNK